jgi:hypothetical protein
MPVSFSTRGEKKKSLHRLESNPDLQVVFILLIAMAGQTTPTIIKAKIF